MSKSLTEKEKTFCRDYAVSGDARGSAARAGYMISPGRSAAKLLMRQEIQREIAEAEKQKGETQNSVKKGLERLAFGSVSDALKLILFSDRMTEDDAETLDLFNVSDIKFSKGGGIEVKFFDRQKALEKLSTLEVSGENPQSSFIAALSKGAEQLTEDDAF